MSDFAAGQIVTVFRSRLRADAREAYEPLAAEMLAAASAMPGYVESKGFRADDGERVTLVTFADAATHAAWRDHAGHRAAQGRGRAELYAAYTIQVSRCLATQAFCSEAE